MILSVAAAFAFCVILKLVRKFCLLPLKLLHLFAVLAVASFKFAHLNRKYCVFACDIQFYINGRFLKYILDFRRVKNLATK